MCRSSMAGITIRIGQRNCSTAATAWSTKLGSYIEASFSYSPKTLADLAIGPAISAQSAPQNFSN